MHALKVRIAAFVSFTVIAADLVPSVRRATEEIFIDLVTSFTQLGPKTPSFSSGKNDREGSQIQETKMRTDVDKQR
jgi:hypothetical protein